MSSRTNAGDGPPRASSPLGDAQAELSYDDQLSSNLNSPTKQTIPTSDPVACDPEDDDDDAFVYTGVDSNQVNLTPAKDEPTYNDQLAAVLDSDDEQHTSQTGLNGSVGALEAVGELTRPVSPLPIPHTAPPPPPLSLWEEYLLGRSAGYSVSTHHLNLVLRDQTSAGHMCSPTFVCSSSPRHPAHFRHRGPRSGPLPATRSPSHPPTPTQPSQACRLRDPIISRPTSRAPRLSGRSPLSPAGPRRSTLRSHACARPGTIGSRRARPTRQRSRDFRPSMAHRSNSQKAGTPPHAAARPLTCTTRPGRPLSRQSST